MFSEPNQIESALNICNATVDAVDATCFIDLKVQNEWMERQRHMNSTAEGSSIGDRSRGKGYNNNKNSASNNSNGLQFSNNIKANVIDDSSHYKNYLKRNGEVFKSRSMGEQHPRHHSNSSKISDAAGRNNGKKSNIGGNAGQNSEKVNSRTISCL
jgi:hypothetical protein